MSQENEVHNEVLFTQFINAIKAGSPHEAEEILRNDCAHFVNKIETQFRQPSLYFAALLSGDDLSAEIIKLLIRYGANAKFKDHNDQTILFYICRQGKDSCAQILLSHGLSLDDVDIYGQTPIFYAVSQNRLSIISRYATKQRVNHVDKLVSQTPLYYAARRGHLQMCKILLEKGSDITHLDNNGKNVVEYAKKAKFIETAEFLANQLRKIRENNRNSAPSQDSGKGKKKEDIPSKQVKLPFKLVFYDDKGQLRDLTVEQANKLFSQKPQLQAFLSNPEIIPSECLTQTEQQSWEKAAQRVLTQCFKLKGSFYFLQPVDPVKFNIMDYFDIVSKPMDLNTVRRKLNHNAYISARDFVTDMNLIWQNTYRYNGMQHAVSKCGKELENTFNELVKSCELSKYLA